MQDVADPRSLGCQDSGLAAANHRHVLAVFELLSGHHVPWRLASGSLERIHSSSGEMRLCSFAVQCCIESLDLASPKPDSRWSTC